MDPLRLLLPSFGISFHIWEHSKAPKADQLPARLTNMESFWDTIISCYQDPTLSKMLHGELGRLVLLASAAHFHQEAKNPDNILDGVPKKYK